MSMPGGLRVGSAPLFSLQNTSLASFLPGRDLQDGGAYAAVPKRDEKPCYLADLSFCCFHRRPLRFQSQQP